MSRVNVSRAARLASGMVLALASSDCIVESVCYSDADCASDRFCDRTAGTCKRRCIESSDCEDGWRCDAPSGRCVQAECVRDDECTAGFVCQDGRCVSEQPLSCPLGMVAIGRYFCIDTYEASRPDATATTAGTDESRSTSRPGVMPWRLGAYDLAAAACVAAGKSLCTPAQWQEACRGPAATVYSYGNEYDVSVCNGIDTYCDCSPGSSCASANPCPYPHCYRTCGVSRPLAPDPTAAFPGCTNDYGVFDMNGNLWEYVLDAGEQGVRGGAFNCLDSEELHRCDYVPETWVPTARGFRCCSLGEGTP